MPKLAEVLAEAFRDNPLNCRVVGSNAAKRLRANRVGMRLTLQSALGRATILVAEPSSVSCAGPLAGGLIALPPGAWPLPPPPLVEQFVALLRQGFGVASRWGRVYTELASLSPMEPHWYLSTLGIRPQLQRKGHASALMERWLAEVDRTRQAAYLETDRRENLRFYANRGFSLIEERLLLEVPIWRMRRSAAGSRSARS